MLPKQLCKVGRIIFKCIHTCDSCQMCLTPNMGCEDIHNQYVLILYFLVIFNIFYHFYFTFKNVE
jgi:hypothetical protein